MLKFLPFFLFILFFYITFVSMNIDELLIIQEYQENCIGLESLAKKYQIGKLKLKKILREHNIPLRKRGGQPILFDKKYDYSVPKYTNTKDYYYKVIDKNNSSFVSLDIMNKGGFLTSYLNNYYNIEIPSLYSRRKYFEQNGNYWWEQWLTYIKEDAIKSKKCPLCEWTTKDIDNKSGCFAQHIHSVHNLSDIEYLQQYPQDKLFFKHTLINKDEYVVCKICGKKLKCINNRHLRIHNTTKQEYILKYGNKEMISSEFYNKCLEQVSHMNLTLEDSERFCSKSELEIKNFLIHHNVDVCKNRHILQGQELDLYIPSQNIAIEYNGLYWYSEAGGKDKHYHINKLNLCNSKGVKLIHIFEDEFINKKQIVLDKISHLLHFNDNKPKVYARKCTISIISKIEAEQFLNKNHIQGYARATVYIGCYFNNILVGVMTFKRRKNNTNDWELNRFATNINYLCCGVGGKLFTYFVNNYHSDSIISFADRRWTLNKDDNFYTKLGFVLDKTLKPDYRYYNSKINRFARIHKMFFSKRNLAKKYGLSMQMTETEMAYSLGYSKIWDCGLFKYKWTI